jgi:hypothetical protein
MPSVAASPTAKLIGTNSPMRRGVPVAGALAPDGVSFYFVDARDPNKHEELALSLSAEGREWIDATSGVAGH